MKRLGILTGGGDAPGLNAVIRAVVKTARLEHQCEVIGVEDGYDGLLEPSRTRLLRPEDLHGLLPRGGTILGTANRGNPFARKAERDGQVVIEDVSAWLVEAVNHLEVDGLIVVGGDGTLRIAYELHQKFHLPVVGVPKTIDNDLNGTDVTFGFDTAVQTATDACDKLHTTAESHHRVMLLELMGRDAGFITLHAGVAGGADVILIPEIPFDIEVVCQKVMDRVETGRKFSVIAVAEGARPKDGEQMFSRLGNELYVPRLGGISYKIGEMIERSTGIETRTTVLGHLQRGGRPSPFDRWLATRFGAAAVRLAAADGWGRMVGLNGERVEDVPLETAVEKPKRVDPEGEPVLTARGLGIVFG